MPQGGPRLRVLIGVVLLELLGVGCKRSQVWLGRVEPAVEPAADSGQAPEPDAGRPPIVSPDAGKPAAGSSAAEPAADGGKPMSAPDAGSVDPLEPTFLPTPRGACPELVSGEVRLLDIPMTMWVGPTRASPGPLMIYWHGVGSSTAEARNLGSAMSEIMDMGGMVVAPAASTEQGTDTGTGTWFTGDFEVIDELVACAVASGKIDKRRIYTSGCSSGGLTAGVMTYLRSGYLAGVQLDSGGAVYEMPLQDATHVPAVIAAHGASSVDVVVVNFVELSGKLTERVSKDGGFAVRCDHGGGHCATPTRMREAQWQFLLAHPYGTQPSPYKTGLPSGFPRECRIVSSP